MSRLPQSAHHHSPVATMSDALPASHPVTGQTLASFLLSPGSSHNLSSAGYYPGTLNSSAANSSSMFGNLSQLHSTLWARNAVRPAREDPSGGATGSASDTPTSKTGGWNPFTLLPFLHQAAASAPTGHQLSAWSAAAAAAYASLLPQPTAKDIAGHRQDQAMQRAFEMRGKFCSTDIEFCIVLQALSVNVYARSLEHQKV